ncbi:nitrogenase iron-molybdenum cofactor biosynthesis protein NifN [Rubrivivax gelatinosus]|uniref:Nitrogenase iron-molybdenum cofactor biosynthesis protein NifN n=1 Tax=Rubrivivax gelatinosus TaxID=28068 RepID=A0ABS1DP98_RUBGE|nr:nitrogenase iron-molybdenum cofactor biosynthesis protein NifN [Rubrivivax gelatinosus]MBK1711834.1 nitrogenase iron-molybdenum cofactor biosynthesis protein NifN [Rubrivivax gelatinosus]
MALVTETKKSCSVNPLKMSAPLGASFAFMGLESCMPLMHGSQGCTSFGLVLLVRHFKEAIPLQTTAMNEATTIMGGYDNLAKALLNIRQRAKPRVIGLCTTGLTETKGDDVDGYIRLARQQHPELADTAVVHASTPDYVGGFQEGWAAAVTAIVSTLPREHEPRREGVVALLPGCHLSPADIEELRETIEAFGLQPLVVPDISGSLDGHIPETWLGTTIGGTPLADIEALGGAVHALAVGEQMRPAAEALQARCGVPFTLFDRLTGLTATDALVRRLAEISGREVPAKLRRQRSQLVDAMLDCHFHTGNAKIALAAEPDLLWAAGSFLAEMGAELVACVTTGKSPLLERLPTSEVLIGDLEDFERSAQAAGAELLMTHAHGRQAAERLGLPLYRIGIPMFDRVGNAHIRQVGYRGTRDFVCAVANTLIEQIGHHGPDDWPLPAASAAAVERVVPAVAHVPAQIPRRDKAAPSPIHFPERT